MTWLPGIVSPCPTRGLSCNAYHGDGHDLGSGVNRSGDVDVRSSQCYGNDDEKKLEHMLPQLEARVEEACECHGVDCYVVESMELWESKEGSCWLLERVERKGWLLGTFKRMGPRYQSRVFSMFSICVNSRCSHYHQQLAHSRVIRVRPDILAPSRKLAGRGTQLPAQRLSSESKGSLSSHANIEKEGKTLGLIK